MMILISPAKTMKLERKQIPLRLPPFLEDTKILHAELTKFDCTQLMKLMKINEKIASSLQDNLSQMKFDEVGYCAIDCYDGVQFKAMDLANMQELEVAYLDKHLHILSGFYGILQPRDSMYPYRLEMQCKLSLRDCTNLYSFWQDKIAGYVLAKRTHYKEPYIINLASKEYDKCIRPYVKDGTWIDINFYTRKDQKLTMHSTQVKNARGQMVRYLAQHQVEDLDTLKKFNVDGYLFDASLSNETVLVFVKE